MVGQERYYIDSDTYFIYIIFLFCDYFTAAHHTAPHTALTDSHFHGTHSLRRVIYEIKVRLFQSPTFSGAARQVRLFFFIIYEITGMTGITATALPSNSQRTIGSKTTAKIGGQTASKC